MGSDLEPSLLRLPERSLLADDVYTIIRESLISGAITPGSRLNLDNLAREMHVSNTPVRQALARLESEGLVTREPYRGFAASQLLDSRTIAELYEYRLILEPPTAARAARSSSGEMIETLEALCDKPSIDALFHAGELDEMAQRDTDFHGTIAELAGNRVISENVRNTLARMSLYSGYKHPGAWSSTWEEHRTIAQAIRTGDPHAAGEMMRLHLKTAYERISSTTARLTAESDTGTD